MRELHRTADVGDASHDPVLRWLLFAVLLVGLPALIGVTPAIAGAPQPVVAVGSPAPTAAPTPEPPAAWEPPPYVCRGDQLDATAGVQASYPGPVVSLATPPPSSGPPVIDCTSVIRVRLIVDSPAGQGPTGIGADVGGVSVPQATLVGGFEISRAPADHAITLSPPPPDWELVSTECICTEAVQSASLGGGSIASRGIGPMLTSFPSPVVAIDALEGGRLICGGASASSELPASASALTMNVATFGSSVATNRTGAPQPVVPIGGGGGIDLDSLGDNTSPASIRWTSDGGIRITDEEGAGGVFLCDWTVKWAFGDVIIETVTDPPGEEDRFGYATTPGFSVPPASSMALAGASPPGAGAEIRKGSWSVELTGLGNGWSVTRSNCTETNDKTVSSASGASATIGMDAGDLVRCRFELGLVSVLLREGRWKADNRPTRFRCGPRVNVPVGRNVKFARLTLIGGGEDMVARGLSAGSGAARMSRDPEDPLRYTGSVRVRAAGGTFRQTATLVVLNAEKATVRLRGTVRVQGRRCTINRIVRLSYAGG